MKYKSELIKEVIDSRGHEKSSIHYHSECIETWIEEAKGAYPKLCDYESEWLNYISILDDTGGSEDPEPPIGAFPYETVSTNTSATVNHVVPYAYKRAILKGQTEGMQSVKMPVLTTTGKNLWRTNFIVGKKINAEGNVTTASNYACIEEYIKILPKTSYVITNSISVNGVQIFEYDTNKNLLNTTWAGMGKITTQPKTEYFRYSAILGGGNNSSEEALRLFQFELGTVATPYEPYKSIILTVNEDVTLRSNGNVYDELNLLTGQLTQRIGEDGVVLSQEVVKTVELSVTDQSGSTLSKIKPIEGTMLITPSGEPIAPTAVLEVPVEAITQNLASFIEEE